MNLEDGKKVLIPLILKDTKHPYYQKTIELKEEYMALITDDTVDEDKTLLSKYLRRFVRREDEELFNQRVRLTKHYTPSICNSIIEVFNKALKSNRIYKSIDTKSNTDSKILDEINERIKKFYGNKSESGVDDFLKERFKVLTFTDPNAWILTTFKKFDANKEKPWPFPVEFGCEDVTNFSIVNNVTEWVLIKQKYSYVDKDDKTKAADKWLMYLENDAIEVFFIPDDIKEVPEYTEIYMDQDTSKKYGLKYYNHKTGMVPLERVGYIADIANKSKTFVNPFHYSALPYLREIIKVTSELQLSITLHAFPKLIQYVVPCQAKGCDGGYTSDGLKCSECNGTGKKSHTTAADIMEFPMPKRVEDLQDLSKVSTYLTTPIDIVKFLDEYVDKRQKNISKAMFRSETLLQAQFGTATEATIDYESIYDTLKPFADQYSKLWLFFVGIIVKYLGFDTVVKIYHKFANDLKIKSVDQLMNDLKKAKDAGASSFVLESLNNDILDNMYSDDQDTLFKLKTKAKFYPFSGKTESEIQSIILNELTTLFNKVLYANFDIVFDEIELEYGDQFFLFATKKQKEIIDKKVNDIMDNLNQAAAEKLDLSGEEG